MPGSGPSARITSCPSAPARRSSVQTWSISHPLASVLAPFSHDICLKASLMDWDHRDPFDRLILATVEIMDIPLVSKDGVLHERHSARVIW